jgi:hypothetical protein
MKISMKIFKLMMVAVLILSTTAVFAQAPTLPNDPENVPIDGGLSLLVAAGVGYAVKRKKDQASKSVVGK